MEYAPILEDKPRTGREAKCICIVGKPNTGKSTAAVTLMKAAGTGLFVLPQADNWSQITLPCNISDHNACVYEGIKHHIYNTDEDFDLIYNNFHNAMICLDDTRAYVKANFEHSNVRKFLMRRRQRMLDVCFMAHGFCEIPPKLFTFITDYVIFPISDSPAYRKKEITDIDFFNLLTNVVNEVNLKGKTDIHYNKWVRKP